MGASRVKVRRNSIPLNLGAIALVILNIYMLFQCYYSEKGVKNYLIKKREHAERAKHYQEILHSISLAKDKLELMNFKQVNISYLEELAKKEFSLGTKDEFLIIIPEKTLNGILNTQGPSGKSQK